MRSFSLEPFAPDRETTKDPGRRAGRLVFCKIRQHIAARDFLLRLYYKASHGSWDCLAIFVGYFAVKDKISEVVDIVRTDWANPLWPIYD